MENEKPKKVVPKGCSPISGTPPPEKYRWKKGQSGNPAGKKPGTTSLTARLRRVLEEDAGDGKKVADLLVEAVTKAALKGDHRFCAMVFERIDGKVADKIEGEQDIQITVRHVDKSGMIESSSTEEIDD